MADGSSKRGRNAGGSGAVASPRRDRHGSLAPLLGRLLAGGQLLVSTQQSSLPRREGEPSETSSPIGQGSSGFDGNNVAFLGKFLPRVL